MITDKDREISKEIINGMDELYLNNMSCNAPMFIEFTANIISRIRAESADQARKEASERAVAFIRTLNSESMDLWGEYEDNGLRAAILGDSVVKENLIADHIPDTGKKLAIAVKALEYVVSKSLPSSVFESHYSRLQDACAKASDALKEIQ